MVCIRKSLLWTFSSLGVWSRVSILQDFIFEEWEKQTQEISVCNVKEKAVDDEVANLVCISSDASLTL